MAGRALCAAAMERKSIKRLDELFVAEPDRPHDTRELVDSSVLLVRDRIEAKEQRLEMQLAPDLPCLTVDGRRIRQILINLLANARL